MDTPHPPNPSSEPFTPGLIPDLSDLAEEASDGIHPAPTSDCAEAVSFGNVAEPTLEVQRPYSHVEVKDGRPDAEFAMPVYPELALDGDYIGDLAYALTKNTAVPMCLARANIKTILSTMIDGRVGFPGHEDLHMRHYSMQIAPPRSGKGESWKRTGALPNGALS